MRARPRPAAPISHRPAQPLTRRCERRGQLGLTMKDYLASEPEHHFNRCARPARTRRAPRPALTAPPRVPQSALHQDGADDRPLKWLCLCGSIIRVAHSHPPQRPCGGSGAAAAARSPGAAAARSPGRRARRDRPRGRPRDRPHPSIVANFLRSLRLASCSQCSLAKTQGPKNEGAWRCVAGAHATAATPLVTFTPRGCGWVAQQSLSEPSAMPMM